MEEFCDNKEAITLDEVIGQKNAIEMLKISIAAAKHRKEILGHILLIGPKGCGKKTVAYAVGNEYSVNIRTVSSNEVSNQGELAALLTSLCDGDIIIIKDFDTINQKCIDLLCEAMSDFKLDVIVGKGSTAREIRVDLPKFTLIGIADKKQAIPLKLKHCFHHDILFSAYSEEELVQLAKKWCESYRVNITSEAAEKIALYANGSNKKLAYTLKRARDFATIINNLTINDEVADKTIRSLFDNELI